MTRRTRPASSITSTARTSSTPTASRSSNICRSSPSGGPTSTACWLMCASKLVPIPINRTTLNKLFGARPRRPTRKRPNISPRAPSRSTRSRRPRTWSSTPSGRELYELFFRGYTRKQWGLDPSELDKPVTARIPTRTNTDDRYFTDTFQAMPRDGYTAMFETHARPSADRGSNRRRFPRRPRRASNAIT